MVTVSPSSRNERVVPSGRATGRSPLLASSMRQPSVPGSVPDTVPEANRSPGRMAAPFTVAWASIWGNVQYWSARRLWVSEAGGMSLTRIHWLWIDTSSRMS